MPERGAKGSPMTQRILIISDDGPKTTLRESLDARDFKVTTATEANNGYQCLLEGEFDLVIIDLAKPITGADLIKRIRATSALNQLKVLTIAEWGTGQATLALSHGANGFEPKPIRSDKVIDAVEKLLRPLAMMASASGEGEAIDPN